MDFYPVVFVYDPKAKYCPIKAQTALEEFPMTLEEAQVAWIQLGAAIKAAFNEQEKARLAA